MQNVDLQKCNEIIKKNNIEFIDLKCIDLSGRLHHIEITRFISSFGFVAGESDRLHGHGGPGQGHP